VHASRSKGRPLSSAFQAQEGKTIMKLWKIEIERTVMVMAESEEQAIQRARRYEGNDSLFNEPDSIMAVVVTSYDQVPLEQRDCIPYFAPHDQSCGYYASQQVTSSREQTDR
jgi:hypothetical protein